MAFVAGHIVATTVLSLNAGRVVTQDALLRRIRGLRGGKKSEAVRTCIKKLRRKLADDAANPTCIFNAAPPASPATDTPATGTPSARP